MTTDHANDPIHELTHDHGHLGTLVQQVTAVVQRMKPAPDLDAETVDELVHRAESLRDALLTHFAREEEGLFPFVEVNVPTLRGQVAQLLADHDAVIAGATELMRVAGEAEGDAAGHATCIRTFDRFVEIYAAHAQTEQALLQACDASLDVAHRHALRALLEAI